MRSISRKFFPSEELRLHGRAEAVLVSKGGTVPRYGGLGSEGRAGWVDTRVRIHLTDVSSRFTEHWKRH